LAVVAAAVPVPAVAMADQVVAVPMWAVHLVKVYILDLRISVLQDKATTVVLEHNLHLIMLPAVVVPEQQAQIQEVLEVLVV
jgi:hypothetical protein